MTYKDEMEPCGKCVVALDSIFTLVTTAEFLADPTPQDLQEIYKVPHGATKRSQKIQVWLKGKDIPWGRASWSY